MTIVGLTGGIGSGKTTAAKMFAELGIPVFIADEEAKKLMNSSKVIRKKLIALFGEEAYQNNTLNKTFIASKIFNNKELLRKINAIVHPKVRKRFSNWATKQAAPYVINEVALLFENDSYKNYDYIITVTADDSEKIKRLLVRDKTSEKKIRSIMDNQMSDADKIKRSDYVIINKRLDDMRKQVLQIHEQLKKKA